MLPRFPLICSRLDWRRRFAALVALAVALEAAPAAPDGEAIFRKQCASCHGERGEGVKDKYAEALTGDWSVAKLARYVATNMPDDTPGTLSAAEAEAVSRYLHDAFYSRAAQLRLHPVRVELARLTAHQHLVTVADLLRGFEPPDPPAAEGRGLEAVYYSAARRGGFDSAKVSHRGVDAAVGFDFAVDGGGAARERAGGGEEFSAQWRGSVIAEETGDHEFVVRTPNSVRVWINASLDPANPVEAAIDAMVSNPAEPDHRVTVRLIAGRSYPIGIDYWALPGKVGAPPPALVLRWRPPHGSERPIPARNLSPAKPRPTFVFATRFPADDASLGYERSVTVSKAWDEATTSVALETAERVARKLDRYAGIRPGDPERARKLETFARRFVAAAWRRPLTDEEGRRIGERLAAAPDPETAARRTVLFALKSPAFLYPELPGGEAPDGARVAARLSFALWDSAPDAELARAADSGRLRSRADIEAQALRMLADPRARAKLRDFFHHWLQLRHLEDLRKDPALYPEFTPEVIDDLRTSLDLFLAETTWGPTADFRELLRADGLFVNDRLAAFYGLPPPLAGEFARVAAPAGERSGVLTHPYLLAALSYRGTTSPIHRGVFLTRRIVGRALKSPPVAVAFNNEEFPPGLSMREKVARLTRQESCQGCHAVINPLGFSLEWYDAAGRFRREENGRPVDATSEYLTDDGQPVRLTGARDVAEFALADGRAQAAFVEELFHHFVKQPILAYGADAPERLRDSFIASGHDIRKLLVAIATVAALRGFEAPAATTAPTQGLP